MDSVVIRGAKALTIEPVAYVPVQDSEVAVEIHRGGICGSDMHYYLHGGFGTISLKEPLILGHEIAGVVIEKGASVTLVDIGSRVAVSPSHPCGACQYCREGLPRHCLNMRFLGSAMPFPHIQGGFREILTVPASCVFPTTATIGEAAMAEPLAVCLHAAARAGSLAGKKVLVTGCGPIGCLCILVARHAGAAEIVATDINAFALDHARKLGASTVIDMTKDARAMADYAAGKGYFDVLLEASGNENAIRDGIQAMRPCGILVQVGLGNDIRLPLGPLVAKEIEMRGTFRFDAEFETAVALLDSRSIDVRPLVTHVLPFREATAAFDLAADRALAMKVQMDFAPSSAT